MGYTAPDLSQVLTNEQTMNSRLTTCRNDLRTILTNEEIGYTEGDGIIPLIRKLPVPQLASMDMTLNNMFSTGSSVTETISAKDNKGNNMANVPIKLYRIDDIASVYPAGTFLGDYTTNSNGQVNITVPMPSNKGMYYVQARSGNIICGEFGMYCTTAMQPNDFGYSSGSNLFSSNGTGGSSGFSVMDVEVEDNYVELVIEAHSGYGGEYFGLMLPELGTFNRSSVQEHTAAILMHDMTNGNKARWIGFSFIVNPTAVSPSLCGAAKYYYGDGTGEYGYRQLRENWDESYFKSIDSGSPESPTKKYYAVQGRAGRGVIYDYYSGDPTAQYPSSFTQHGQNSGNMNFFKSGDGNFGIIFNMGGISGSYRYFRIYGAGVI